MPATRELFGQVAVRKGYATLEQIDEALQLQRDLHENGARKLLGMILLESGVLGPKELIDILQDIRIVTTARYARRGV